MLGVNIPSKKELQETMPSCQSSQRSSRSSRPRSYQEDYRYGGGDAPPVSRPEQRMGIVRLQDGRKAFTHHIPSSNRQPDRTDRQCSYQSNFPADGYYPEPPRQSQYSRQAPQRDDSYRDSYGRQGFNTLAVAHSHSRTLYDSSRPRPSQPVHADESYNRPTYEYNYDPAFARAISRADRAGPRTVDVARPTRLIQNTIQSYNIHLQCKDPHALRHHNLMVRNYGLECAMCIKLDREQFGYVPRPSGYMEVGVDDPFCFLCGLKHPAIGADAVNHGNFGLRTGRLRRYDEDGEDDREPRGGAGARIMKRTEHVAEQAAAEMAEEAAAQAEAVASGAIAIPANTSADANGDWVAFGNAAKGGKARKKDNQ